MDLIQTIIIAIVEGLTEFLPVSSTGHMIITQNLLGVESTPFVKAYTIIIQFGAILSVICLYWKRFFRLDNSSAPEGSSKWQCFIHKWDFYWKLLVAFIPAVIIGLIGKKSGLTFYVHFGSRKIFTQTDYFSTAERKIDGHDGGEPFRDRGDRQTDGDDEGIEDHGKRELARAQQRHAEDHDADAEHEEGQNPRQMRELDL